MSTTRIFIARHGETEYNRLNQMQGRGINKPLNKNGRMQAKAIADFLGSESIDHIFSSSLMRSMETAEIIAWSYRKEYKYYPELDEMDFGYLEGHSAEEIQSDLDEIHAKWSSGKVDFAPKDGESPVEVSNRILSRTSKIIEEHGGSNILFILHGRSIRILLSEWLGYGLENMHKVTHSNGALYHLEHTAGQFEPVYLHETEHLDDLSIKDK
ncbi:MAG: histidine phosphatase family protein [Balneolaceae bacterium]|nr:histidine phosphatase family protein [Balneolaceae bacterium]